MHQREVVYQPTSLKVLRSNSAYNVLGRSEDECTKAKANGHYCANASAAKGISGAVIVTGSSKNVGDCPQCPPALPKAHYDRPESPDIC